MHLLNILWQPTMTLCLFIFAIHFISALKVWKAWAPPRVKKQVSLLKQSKYNYNACLEFKNCALKAFTVNLLFQSLSYQTCIVLDLLCKFVLIKFEKGKKTSTYLCCLSLWIRSLPHEVGEIQNLCFYEFHAIVRPVWKKQPWKVQHRH